MKTEFTVQEKIEQLNKMIAFLETLGYDQNKINFDESLALRQGFIEFLRTSEVLNK